ncbi:XkdX family protein [Paenibacillus sp. 2TAB19]
MDWFGIIKRHYDAGRYTVNNVATFVIGNKITTLQYEEITGETYGASE